MGDARRSLLVTPEIGPKAATALVDAGWSWADRHGNCDLRAPGLRLRQAGCVTALEPRAAKLPASPVARGVIRWLISAFEEAAPITVTALAELIGVSQAAVSKVIKQLRALDLVGASRGLHQVDRAALLHEFARQYPGAGGHVEYAYTLDFSPDELAQRLVKRYGSSIAISADLGPDKLAAWRVPTSLIVYARKPIELGPLGLVSAAGSGDANVYVQYPSDLSVFVH